MAAKPRYKELEQEHYRILFESANDAIFLMEAHRFSACNEATVRMFGCECKSDVIGHSPWEFSPPKQPNGQDSEQQSKALIAAAGRGTPQHFEWRHTQKDGTPFDTEVSLNLLALEDRTLIQAIVRDITDRKKTEKILGRKNEEQALLLDSIPIQLWYLEDPETYGAVNQAHADFLGFTKEKLENRRLDAVLPAEKARLLKSSNPRVFAQKTVLRTQEWWPDAAGNERLLAVTRIPRIDENGDVEFVVCTGFDITERKKAEEELNFQTLILDQIQDTVTATDLQGRITYVNEAMARSQKCCREELLGRKVITYGQDPSRGPSQQEIMEYTLKNGQWRGEVINFDADGNETIMDCRTKLLADDNGNPLSMIGFATDITQRKRWEEALWKSERQKNLILNSTAEMITYYDLNLRVIWANQAAAASVGAVPEDLVGRHCYEIWQNSREPCPGCPVLKARTDKRFHQAEMQTPDGRCWLNRGYPVIDPGGEVSALVEFTQEITERKQAEEEKERLQAQVHQAQKLESIGRLAGGVAHDLNNVLSPILGYGEMVLDDTASDDHRQGPLQEIVKAGSRARGLVRQLLAFSRKQAMEFQIVSVNDLLQNFQQLLRRTIREDIPIHLELTPSVPLIKGDIGQLEQVVLNLAVNAQDAMPDGGELTIETRVAELDAEYASRHRGVVPGAYGMVAISDTGHGMDAETMDHVFEPFFTTKEKEKGTGLGLATAYGIIKQHRGNIWIYSEPEVGTTVKIYLPATAESLERAPHAPQPESVGNGSETILLVEDDAQVRDLAFAMLRRLGYTVLSAENGKKALAILACHKGPIHLLLTDVIMPDMNGKELYTQIFSANPHIRALYMSGYTDNVVARHGVLHPGVNFIQKPFSVRELANKLREVLQS